MKLHNRTKDSTFQPLDNPHAQLPKRATGGGGLSRDRKARIAFMLRVLRACVQSDVPGSSRAWFEHKIDEIIVEVEK